MGQDEANVKQPPRNSFIGKLCKEISCNVQGSVENCRIVYVN